MTGDEKDEVGMSILLDEHLTQWAGRDPARGAIVATVLAIAEAGRQIADLVADGPLAGAMGASRGIDNGGGDVQKELDVRADEIILAALKTAPVAAYASEEADHPVALDPSAPILVAADPLDGSSNIDINSPIGTIFSLLPRLRDIDPADDAAFLQTGRRQLASGYVIYGPHVALVLTVGAGTQLYVLDRAAGAFRLDNAHVQVAPFAKEFAINMSNHRFWDDRLRLYVDDLLMGKEGPNQVDYNMRWIAAMVAEAHRILLRGGIFLYPGDKRPGYEAGRLRLMYEGNPIAFVMEQAGAAATDGTTPILDLVPERLHQRTPLVFGSIEKVRRVETYLVSPHEIERPAKG